MSATEADRCPECGAVLEAGQTCDDLFGTVLAWEQQGAPEKYAYHHVLVMSWELQHPSRFSDEVLVWAHRALHDVLVDGEDPRRLLADARRTVGRPQDRTWRMRRVGGDVVSRRWSRTLSDVVAEGYDAMPGSVRALGDGVLADMPSELPEAGGADV